MDIDQISHQIELTLKPYIGTYVVNVNTMDMVRRAITDYLAIHSPKHDWDVKITDVDGSKVTVTCTPPQEVIARLEI